MSSLRYHELANDYLIECLFIRNSVTITPKYIYQTKINTSILYPPQFVKIKKQYPDRWLFWLNGIHNLVHTEYGTIKE